MANEDFRYPARWPTQVDELRAIMPNAEKETLDRVIEVMDWRDRMLEDWLSNLDPGIGGYTASWNGLLVSGPRTGRWYAPGYDVTIDTTITSLITAGSSSTTLRILTGTGTGSPSSAATITLTSSTAYQEDTVNVSVPDGDYCQLEIQTAGTGAIGLLCQFIMTKD